MSQGCPSRAVLIVTQGVTGTASNVARRRVELCCSLAEGHDGEHVDKTHGEKWHDQGRALQTILRHQEADDQS